jgi:hypothetical protein
MGDIKLTLAPVDELSAMADEQKAAAQQHFVEGCWSGLKQKIRKTRLRAWILVNNLYS